MIETVEARTIRGSRSKALLCLLGSLGFVVLTYFFSKHSASESIWVWSGAGFFALCALVSAWLLVRPQILILDGRGFKLSGGLIRSHQEILWQDIQGFFVYRLLTGGSMIGFNFEAAERERSKLAWLGKKMGADGALPQGWPRSTEEMVEELNAYRLRALSQ